MSNEKKQFSLTLDKDITERLQHLRKVSAVKGKDAYQELSFVVLKWLVEKEKNLKIEKNDYKNANICPECASKLSIRKGKAGDFIGCSSFPKCKYTKSI